MWFAMIMFAIVVALVHDLWRRLKDIRAELDNRAINEIIRLLKIWQQDSEIFCEQNQHDQNNNTPTLNYNMAAHKFRSWLDEEINKVGYLSGVWKDPDLKIQIEKAFDAQTCKYISNCFPSIYRWT
jgi:hypothetical protein